MRSRIRRVLVPLLLLFVSTLHAAIPASERAALIKIYESLGGAQWSRNTNWLSTTVSECDWAHVTCDAAKTTVIGINLGYVDAKGTIPKEVSGLTNLERFEVYGNAQVTGTLPPEIALLSKLQVLNLSGIYGLDLTGPIPPQLGQLTNLRVLDLGGNEFTGPIPPELASLLNLEILELGYTRLEGSIPEAIFRLPKLRELRISNAGIEGVIGPQFSSSLEVLDLSGNDLTGPIPDAIVQASALRELILANNKFSGRLPAALGQLTKLTVIELNSNGFEGELPNLGALTALTRLWIWRTNISGPLPSWIGQLRELVDLGLSDTDMGGPLPAELFTLPKLESFWAEDVSFSGKLADFSKLPTLKILNLRRNSFSGPFPVELTTLAALEELDLSRMPLGGTIPSEIGRMKTLRYLFLHEAQLTGPIPDSIGELTALRSLYLYDNSLTAIPSSIGNLKDLQVLLLDRNRFSGPIPAETFKPLTKLTHLYLYDNQFEGAIPPQLFTIATLQELRLAQNRLTGAIPPIGGLPALQTLDVSENQLTALPADLASLANLRELYAGQNQLDGPIPDLSTLTRLRTLNLWANRFSGPIPNWLGTLTSLNRLDVGYNKLSGNIPSNFANLTNLGAQYSLGLWYNALTATDPAVKAFVDARDPGWSRTQTVPPTNAAIAAQRERSITLSWTPIEYDDDPGGYQISVANSAAGPFTLLTTTPDKSIPTFILDGLDPSTDYFFRVQTVTYPHDSQQNVVRSDPTPPVAGRTTTGVPSPAKIIVFSPPGGLYQRRGTSGATDNFVLGNLGDLPANLTLTKEGTFFTIDPASVTIAGASSVRIGLTALDQPAGDYRGRVVITGDGVGTGITLDVRLFVSEPPSGIVSAQPNVNRIDVAAVVTENPTGTVEFRNTGTATLNGIVVSNVVWIVPPPGVITIPVGESRSVTFTVDRAKRPDSGAPAGSVVGTLSLVYDAGAAAGKIGDLDGGSVTTTTPVTVVDTIKQPVTPQQVPPLVGNQVAFMIPGAGYVIGNNNRLFLSDISVVNAFGVDALNDIKMYFSPIDPAAGSTVADVVALPPNQSVAYGNVVNSVFNGQTQGTIQVRTSSPDRIAINANIFAVSDPRGTYGTAIPIFRSDRALAPGESLYLTGVIATADFSMYTNLLVQEMSGGTASYEIEFFDVTGKSAGTKIQDSVSPFRLKRHNNAVPVGAVGARVTNASNSGGRIAAYATPLDARSGDFWAVVDWNRAFNSSLDEPVIIPVAGSTQGANAYFRSDVAVTNRGTVAGEGTLSFYDRSGATRRYDLTLPAGESRSYDDVIRTLFPDLASPVGYLEFVPRSGRFSMSSRAFATVPNLAGTYGTAVPALPRSIAIRAGQTRIINGVEISSEKTIGDKRGGTFRTNIGLVEITGQPVTVDVTVTYADIKQVVYATRVVKLPYTVPGHQLLLDSGFTQKIKQANPLVADLRNVKLEFKVTGGDGAVIVFTSSVDNGTADQVLRTE